MANQNGEVQKDGRLSRIAEGKHAHVVESGNPSTILKITRCPETVELLRRLKYSPIAGLPEVLCEIDSSDITQYAKDKFKGKNVVCFEIVKCYKIEDTPKELAITKKFLRKYIEEPSTGNPIKILKDGSQQLKDEGYYQFANVIEYLVAFLADRPKAYLDDGCGNFMIDNKRNLIYIDPISCSDLL